MSNATRSRQRCSLGHSLRGGHSQVGGASTRRAASPVARGADASRLLDGGAGHHERRSCRGALARRLAPWVNTGFRSGAALISSTFMLLPTRDSAVIRPMPTMRVSSALRPSGRVSRHRIAVDDLVHGYRRFRFQSHYIFYTQSRSRVDPDAHPCAAELASGAFRIACCRKRDAFDLFITASASKCAIIPSRA